MGQGLNCIWVLLSAVALVHSLRRSPRCGATRRVELFGLICVLVLLFPVISANDDLLQQQALNNPVSPILKSLWNGKAVCENGTAPGSACRLLLPGLAAQGMVASEATLLISLLSLGATKDRSPPRTS